MTSAQISLGWHPALPLVLGPTFREILFGSDLITRLGTNREPGDANRFGTWHCGPGLVSDLL